MIHFFKANFLGICWFDNDIDLCQYVAVNYNYNYDESNIFPFDLPDAVSNILTVRW